MKISKFLTLDFWIFALMFLFCFAFLVFYEVIPFDFFTTHHLYKKDSQYIYQKTPQRVLLCRKEFYNQKLQSYYEDPEQFFKKAIYTLKSRYKNKEIAIVAFDNMTLVVHKFFKKNLFDFFLAIPFRSSSAYKSWHYGQILQKNKIPSTTPLFVIEKKLGPICLTSYLITNYISGSLGTEFFEKNSPYKEKWQETIDNLHTTFSNLDSLNIKHKKVQLNSFVVKGDTPYLIDLAQLQKSYFKLNLLGKNNLRKYFLNLKEELFQNDCQAYQLFENKSFVISH